MTQAAGIDSTAREVTCPTCDGPSLYAPTNPHRPFCCERCRQLDLGAWASERFKLSAQVPPTEGDDAQWPQTHA